MKASAVHIDRRYSAQFHPSPPARRTRLFAADAVMTAGNFSGGGEGQSNPMDYMSAGGLKDILGGNTLDAAAAAAAAAAGADRGGHEDVAAAGGVEEKAAATATGGAPEEREGGRGSTGGKQGEGRGDCPACGLGLLLDAAVLHVWLVNFLFSIKFDFVF